MEIYKQLSQYPVFSIETLLIFYTNPKSAYSMLYRLLKKGLIKKIRHNCYSPINLSTGEVMASKYQIACAINDSCYLSHHSALEYYGYTNQVFNEIYVSSNTKFNDFEFEHIAYKCIQSKSSLGIERIKYANRISITDLERTIIDTIKDLNKITGLEECMKSLKMIPYLDESKLKVYLDDYNIQGLYQKAGFILEHYQKELQLSDLFIQYCKDKVGKSTRYLVSESEVSGYYNKAWRIVVPKSMLEYEFSEDIDA